MLDADQPFHAGEVEAQRRAGVGEVASRSGAFIRDHMPEQHRAFYEAQPFLVVASEDVDRRVWTTIIEGGDGFMRAPDARTLTLDAEIDPQDLTRAFSDIGQRIGLDWAQGTAAHMSPSDIWERLLVDGLARDFQHMRLEFLRRLLRVAPA